MKDKTLDKLDKNKASDYVDADKFIELKSRNNNYNKYHTTMIGYNIIIKFLTLNDDV